MMQTSRKHFTAGMHLALCLTIAACVVTTDTLDNEPQVQVPAVTETVTQTPEQETAGQEVALPAEQVGDSLVDITVPPMDDTAGQQQPEAATPLVSFLPEPVKVTPEPDIAPVIDIRQLAIARDSVRVLCDQIGNKLGSVSVEDCNAQDLQYTSAFSINQRSLVTKEIVPVRPVLMDFKVLIMGGIHGDEYSSISIMFKWLELFSPMSLEGEYHWRFAPLVNPDGLLDGQAKRQNANGVDLNRNFPSEDWSASAVKYWQESTGSNPRRFPGNGAASEPEVQWLVDQIEEFQPDVIVSVHAPYHLLDFDGPAVAPDRIGELYLHQLGVYPGSLGNYAGLHKRIPVVTLELPSAGIMPSDDQIDLMWVDLVNWLDREGRNILRAQASN